MPESIQHKLDRVRKPRVHITYDVETNGAQVKKELPFVMGVVGDFSGNPTAKPDPLTKRKFVSIDRDNFNSVMKAIKPELNMRVKNTLAGDDSEMGVQLKFQSMDDFTPGRVVDQVPALKKLLESRNQLRELLTTMDMSDDLEGQLEKILKDTDKVAEAAKNLGIEGGNSNGGGE